MASRRAAFQRFLESYLQHYYNQEQARLQNELIAGREAESAKRQERLASIQRMTQDPVFARRFSLTDPTLAAYNPTDEELTLPLQEGIAGAKTIGEVPSIEDVLSQARSRGVDTTPEVTGRREFVPAPEPGALESFRFPMTSRPPIEQLLKQRQGKVAALNTANELEDDRKIAVAGGTEAETLRQRNTAANTFLPDVIRRTNEELTGTQDTRSADEFQRALQSARGQFLDPDVHAKRLELAQAGAAFGFANQVPTEGERRAAGQLQPLVNAHDTLTQLETKGFGNMAGLETVSRNPVLANSSPVQSAYGPDALAYGQAVEEWTNIAGYIISGVQVRVDERANFKTAMIPNRNDPPEVKAQKQRSREAFLRAAQISAGRAGRVAGRALAEAIQRGDLDAKVLNMLEMTPEVKSGFVSVFGPAGRVQ